LYVYLKCSVQELKVGVFSPFEFTSSLVQYIKS
jgi:hypothetical protein